MNVGAPQAPAKSSATAIASLLLSIAGCVVLPLIAVIVGLFNKSLEALTGAIIVGGLCVLAAVILAIISLARGSDKTMPVVALVLSVLSIPAGIVATFFGILFSSSGSHGRPFRAGKDALKTPSKAGDAWSTEGPQPWVDGLDREVRAALADAWLGDAALEHASVAAFGGLALDLVALGAPPALIRRAHEAALDEIEHARACFALASAYAGRSLTAAPFPAVTAPRAAESAAERLRRVALETAIDGCIGEGTAAEAARAAAGLATDPVVRDVLARIAREEQQHADFAWALLAWCLAQDAALAPVVNEALANEPAPKLARSRLDLAAHGRIDQQAWSDARARAAQVSAQR